MSEADHNFICELSLIAHCAEKFIIVARAFHAVLDEFHRLDRISVRQEPAEDPHAVERFRTQQEIVATRTRRHDIDSRENSFV